MLWFLFGFRGRASRQTYWLAILFLTFVYTAFAWPIITTLLTGEELDQSEPFLTFAEIVFFVILWSSIAVSMKRLHDMGLTGIIAFAALIPIVNLALTIWIGVMPGQAGPNKYGPAPDMPPA